MIDRPAAPQRAPRRDWFAPAIVAGSVMLHAGIVAPLIWAPRAEAAKPPVEITVEVVQVPAEPAKPPPEARPKPAEARAKPPSPRQQQVQAKPPAPKTASKTAPETASETAHKPAEKDHAAKPAKAPRTSVAQRMEQLIGPMQAMVMPSLASGDNPFDDPVSYRQLVLSRVAKQKREDRHDGIPAHSVIAFALGDQGEVVRCEVKEKSIDPGLDTEAMAMVYRGAPYPPPPPGAMREFTFGLGFHAL